MNTLVIDIGTSSMRGILFDSEGLNLLQKQVSYQVTFLSNGWVEQDTADWKSALYRIVCGIVKEANDHRWKIDAIAVTSQRSSVFPVDGAVNPLRKAIMWQDKRTDEMCRNMKCDNELVFALSGARINPVFSGSKMAWIKEQCPEIYEKTYKFLIVPDYIIYLMTEELCTDYTYGSRSHLMNIYRKEWDDRLLELFGITRRKLNGLIEPGSICGKTSRKFAEITGCEEGIPVITAGGDQQCGAVGQGVLQDGTVSVTEGTGGFVIAVADEIPANIKQDVICNCASLKGKYILESNVLTCCSAFDWFRREFLGNCSCDEANALLEKVPEGANGCLCIPYFQGRTTPDWNYMAKGVFANVTLATTKADMFKSMVEGICYEVRNNVETMEKYLKVSNIYINGGLTNSSTFNQIQCNALGRKVVRRGDSEATAKGALMIAWETMGIYSSIEESYKVILKQEKCEEYYPENEKVLLYEGYRADMNRIYEKMES